MPLGLSTSWNAALHSDGARMLKELTEQTGFASFELSFNLTRSMVEGIEAAHADVLSVHNYCPIPEGFARPEALPDCYALSAPDEEQRERAVRYTRRTIETAGRLGARAVVLHCGRVEIPDRTHQLISLFESGESHGARFRQLRQEHLAQRRECAGVFLTQACASLQELIPAAQKEGIFLGIENRFYIREIPSFEETALILKRFAGAPLRYWHDTGHAFIQERLGLNPHLEWLKRYGPSLGGMHLHDVVGLDDHRAPGTGIIDFGSFAPFRRKDTLMIVETHRPAAAAEIRASRALFEKTA